VHLLLTQKNGKKKLRKREHKNIDKKFEEKTRNHLDRGRERERDECRI
jgi:hypothetical protein